MRQGLAGGEAAEDGNQAVQIRRRRFGESEAVKKWITGNRSCYFCMSNVQYIVIKVG